MHNYSAHTLVTEMRKQLEIHAERMLQFILTSAKYFSIIFAIVCINQTVKRVTSLH